MIDSVERNDVNPVCPHCQAELPKIGFRAMQSFLGKRYVSFCLQCLKVLGVSHRKGFWMG